MDYFENEDSCIVQGLPDREASRRDAVRPHPAEPSYLLEHLHNTVTIPDKGHINCYEVAKCGCRCWFCPECCVVEGYKLRGRLIPVLETFTGLIMASLTVDPELFPDPKTAYLYIMDKRCIGVTTQDLYRWGCLSSRRYFYVVEWQKNTEQAHFHILYDTVFLSWDSLLASWSKHRPEGAGIVKPNRPPFGTVIFSAPKFADPVHAARYATKYLIKVPDHGFPQWVLDMGNDRRIRRFSTSRGFWGTSTKPHRKKLFRRKKQFLSYSERIRSCGDSVNLFEISEEFNKRRWIDKIDIPARSVIPNISDSGNPKRNRRNFLAMSKQQAFEVIYNASRNGDLSGYNLGVDNE